MSALFNDGKFRGETDLGTPGIGFLLYTYESGNYSLPKVTYSDFALTVPNSNPIVLNARGEANVFLGSGTYSFSLRTPQGTVTWTQDGITSPNSDLNSAVSLIRTDLADHTDEDKGASLLNLNVLLNYDPGTVGRNLADDEWNPCGYPWLAPRNGTTDATAAIQACITAASTAGATVRFPGIAFSVNSLVIPSNTHLKGAGIGKTILKQISGANDLMHLADPGSATTFTSNVTVEDLTMQGTVTTDGFQEVLHLMFTQGCSDLFISRVEFKGWRGDALYIGTGSERGQNPSQLRHNRGVRVKDCIFNGQSTGTQTTSPSAVVSNRNAISFSDIDGAWVETCYFTACSQPGMPGPIDIENENGGTPNGTASIFRNINILNNKFKNNFGEGTISFNFHNDLSTVNPPIFGITIDGNDIDQPYANARGVGILLTSIVIATRAVQPMGIYIANNKVSGTYSPFLVNGVRDVTFVANKFRGTRYSAEIGNNSLDISFINNEFALLAVDNTAGGNGIFIYSGDNISFLNNLFDSCGKADYSYNSNISLATGGTKSRITTIGNTFYSPIANANAWPVRHDAGVLSAGTTKNHSNTLINVNGGFVNYANDFTTDVEPVTIVYPNPYTSYGTPMRTMRLWKDSTGQTHLEGVMKRTGSVVTNEDMVTIPTGYQSAGGMFFNVYTSAGPGTVFLASPGGGVCSLQATSLPTNALISLNLSWQADQ